MRSVNIAELKNRLSTYLSYAKNGEEIVIRDRNLPVAKIVPFDRGNAGDDELLLVAEGKMKLPDKPATAKDIEEWDSLKHIRLMVAIERKYKIRFTNADVESLRNVGDLVDAVDAKVAGKSKVS